MKPTIASTWRAIDARARPVNSSGLRCRVVVPVVELDADRQVGQRVVRGGLVGDDVDRRVVGQQLRARARRRCRAPRWRAALRASRASTASASASSTIVGLARRDSGARSAARSATGSHVDADGDAAVHRHGERLRAAHAAEPGGQRDRAGRACRSNRFGGDGARTSRRCPAGCPGCRCRSTTRPSSARTWSARAAPAGGTPARSPSRRPGWSWRSAPAAPTRGCAARRPAGRLCTSSVSSCSRSVSVRKIASKLRQSRAALPVPP